MRSKGHRSVGGMRASIYNAMPMAGVDALVEYMREFQRSEGIALFKIHTLNNISVRGLERLPRDRYEVASEIGGRTRLLVRSADMHSIEIPASVLAVAARAPGTNNIPVTKLSERGVPVFNAPGANANAVKELVLAGMFLAARNICQAWGYVRSLEGDDHALEAAVEKGKKKFVGYELPGSTLGVVGLGAIGVEVANAALASAA